MSADSTLDRLLALPAELRNEIYSYLLPYPLPDLIIRARYVRLRWIVASRKLFNDVAPSLYSNSTFTTYLKLDPTTLGHGTLTGDFRDHLRLTYGQTCPRYAAPRWLNSDACKLVRYASVDIAAPDFVKLLGTTAFPFDGFVNTLANFKSYFADASNVFPNLRSLRLCFQHQLIDVQMCPSNDLRKAILQILDEFRQTLPIEVYHNATRNYNALSPLVSLPINTLSSTESEMVIPFGSYPITRRTGYSLMRSLGV